jgi:hypothetical protein
VTPSSTSEPDLSGSSKSAKPLQVPFYQGVTFTIVVHNGGTGAADVELLDVPPLPYRVGTASGGIWWDDRAGAMRWQGGLAAGESRVFSFVTHGPKPPLPQDTIYTNRVTIDDGVHPPLVRSVSVVANPGPPVWKVWLPLAGRRTAMPISDRSR